MNDAYSPFKATRHLDVIKAVREGKPARPVHVQIILSDLCNQACSFCAYRDPTYTSSQLFRVEEPGTKGLRKPGLEQYNFNPNRMIPYEKVIEILDDCAAMGVHGIQFTGGGEPTVHPQFEDICEYAHDLGISYAVVTNGVKAAKVELAYWLAKAAWVRFSVDAGNADTYRAVRNCPPSHWDAVWEGVGNTVWTREHLCYDTVIGVGFVVTPQNWREVVQATRLAKQHGADNIRISAQFSAEDEKPFAEFYDECAALCREAEALSDHRFTVFNRFGARIEDLRQKAPEYQRCGYQQFTTYVGGDLNVYRCCGVAYNQRGLVGSLKNRRFRDLWMSQERADNMREFDARGCDRCQFGNQNRLIDYMTRPDEPLHSEFV